MEKKKIVTETETIETSSLNDQSLNDDPQVGCMNHLRQTHQKPQVGNCLLKLKSRMRIGCWNVGTLHQTGKLAQLTKEMQHYNLSIVGVCESSWNTFGEETATGETFPTHTVCLIEWKPISEWIITTIQCYAPTNTAVYEENEAAFQRTPKRDIEIGMGDLNAKIGKDNDDWRNNGDIRTGADE